jgi:uncharacterized protein (DUF1330 family)
MAMSASVRAYRRAVEPLLIRHNARQLTRAKVKNAGIGQPDEIHIIKFEDMADLAALQADPDYLALADLRQEAMMGTTSYIADEYATFLD